MIRSCSPKNLIARCLFGLLHLPYPTRSKALLVVADDSSTEGDYHLRENMHAPRESRDPKDW